MVTFTDIAKLIPTLGHQLGEGAGAEDAQLILLNMQPTDLDATLHEWATFSQLVEQISLTLGGVTAIKSSREAGHSGFAQSRGYRSPASLMQELTGSTRSEAARLVRVGEALVHGTMAPEVLDGAGVGVGPGVGAVVGAGDGFGAGDSGGSDDGAGGDTDRAAAPAVNAPWHAPLGRALHANRLHEAQFEAIRRGLGEPPAWGDRATAGADGVAGGDAAGAGDGDDAATADALGRGEAEAAAAFDAEFRDAWSLAAETLIDEAASRTTEELLQQARLIRDQLDPEGAEARFMARFEKRSFYTYRGSDGQKRGSWVFDDEGDIFVETLLSVALRPRRGGPQFVDSEERARAQQLIEDPRTNEQLTYDLIMDVLRAGSLADASSVFGTRQAAVRLVQIIDTTDAETSSPLVYSEDGLLALPAAVATQRICDSGTVTVSIDPHGNPLNVGRESRLFNTTQRIALAIRDGGCRWPQCERPASYCEAHHIDPYSEGGRTDIDRGILLCHFHHMNLHHKGWRITRTGREDFVLTHPTKAPVTLTPRAALKYAWDHIHRPPRRFRTNA